MCKVLSAFLRTMTVLAALGAQPAMAAKYYCGGRVLSAGETAQAEQVMEAIRKTLPPAAEGWVISSDGGGVDCGEAKQPVPANILVQRSYLYMGEAAADSGREDQAKFAEAEQKLAALKKEQEALVAKLNEARATRDPKQMQPLQQRMRELQQAQAAQSRELAKLRGEIQRKAAERKNAEWAASQKQENKASISVTANQRWFSAVYKNGKEFSVKDVPIALQSSYSNELIVTQLYLGNRMPEGPEGKVALDEAAPMLRAQNLAVRIDARAEPTQWLLQGLDTAALKALLQP